MNPVAVFPSIMFSDLISLAFWKFELRVRDETKSEAIGKAQESWVPMGKDQPQGLSILRAILQTVEIG